ncbi:MAG: hypothetical protein U5Q44_07310 [Dehalococcoidia bacterium]|nr:hypothetical protein [Dehalococcoidia bacterium]
MGKRRAGIAMLGLFLLLGLVAGRGATGVQAATLDVCPSGCTYSSIQAAIDARVRMGTPINVSGTGRSTSS